MLSKSDDLCECEGAHTECVTENGECPTCGISDTMSAQERSLRLREALLRYPDVTELQAGIYAVSTEASRKASQPKRKHPIEIAFNVFLLLFGLFLLWRYLKFL